MTSRILASEAMFALNGLFAGGTYSRMRWTQIHPTILSKHQSVFRAKTQQKVLFDVIAFVSFVMSNVVPIGITRFSYILISTISFLHDSSYLFSLFSYIDIIIIYVLSPSLSLSRPTHTHRETRQARARSLTHARTLTHMFVLRVLSYL